jgi:hypothetical protein
VEVDVQLHELNGTVARKLTHDREARDENAG